MCKQIIHMEYVVNNNNTKNILFLFFFSPSFFLILFLPPHKKKKKMPPFSSLYWSSTKIFYWAAALVVALTASSASASSSSFGGGGGGLDEETDWSNEISDNTRNVVFGIKCGCCKAVTAEIGFQFDEIREQTTTVVTPPPTSKEEEMEEDEEKKLGKFRSKYVGLFEEKLQASLDRMCRPPPTRTSSTRAIEKSTSVAKRWRYSKDGAKAIQNSMMHINTLGMNATEEDMKQMERVVLGIQLFTNDANKHFRNPNPKVAENSGGTNLMADSFVTAELLDACRRIAESLELEDQLDEAKKNGEFGINEQHKTCLDLEYCKVRKGGAKAKDTRTSEQKDRDEALERMKRLFVTEEEMNEFKKNNPSAFEDNNAGVDPLDETLDSPTPKTPRREDHREEEL